MPRRVRRSSADSVSGIPRAQWCILRNLSISRSRPAEADAWRPVERRPVRLQPHERGDDQDDRREHHQEEEARDDVERALGDGVRAHRDRLAGLAQARRGERGASVRLLLDGRRVGRASRLKAALLRQHPLPVVRPLALLSDIGPIRRGSLLVLSVACGRSCGAIGNPSSGVDARYRLQVDRARRGGSGALHPQSALAGLNPPPRGPAPGPARRPRRRWPGPARCRPANQVRSGRKQP